MTSKKKKTHAQPKVHVSLYMFLGFAIFQIVAVIVLATAIAQVDSRVTESVDTSSTPIASDDNLRDPIIQAVSSLSEEAPYGDNQYVPEMGLRIPLSAQHRIAYMFNPEFSGQPEHATITTTALKRNSQFELSPSLSFDDLMAKVQPYQNCSRPFIITRASVQDNAFVNDYIQVGSVPLQSGELYILQNKDQLCVSANAETMEAIKNLLMATTDN